MNDIPPNPYDGMGGSYLYDPAVGKWVPREEPTIDPTYNPDGRVFAAVKNEE